MFNYPENTSFYSQFREDEKAFHEKYSSVDSADLFQASSYNGEFAKHGQAVRGGSNLKLKVDKTVSNLMMELHGFKGTVWVKSLCRTSRFESAIKTKQFPFISPTELDTFVNNRTNNVEVAEIPPIDAIDTIRESKIDEAMIDEQPAIEEKIGTVEESSQIVKDASDN